MFYNYSILKKKYFSNYALKINASSIYLKLTVLTLTTFLISIVYQSIIESKIYLPGLYWIAQTIVYSLEDKLNQWSVGSFINYKAFGFYLIGFAINIFLIIFAFFKMDKKYALWLLIAMLLYTFWGFIFSLQIVREKTVFIRQITKLFDNEEVHRTKKIEFYLIALASGSLIGSLTSLIWRLNISAGGLDVIYTYIAIKKRRSISSFAIPISLFFITINVIVNEVIMAENSQLTNKMILIIFFLINSVLYSYAYTFILEYLYPKFKIVTIMIVSQNINEIEKVLKKNFTRTATIINATGLYQKQGTNLILITSTFLEKNEVINMIKLVDRKSFVTVMPTQETHGNFKLSLK